MSRLDVPAGTITRGSVTGGALKPDGWWVSGVPQGGNDEYLVESSGARRSLPPYAGQGLPGALPYAAPGERVRLVLRGVTSVSIPRNDSAPDSISGLLFAQVGSDHLPGASEYPSATYARVTLASGAVVMCTGDDAVDQVVEPPDEGTTLPPKIRWKDKRTGTWMRVVQQEGRSPYWVPEVWAHEVFTEQQVLYLELPSYAKASYGLWRIELDIPRAGLRYVAYPQGAPKAVSTSVYSATWTSPRLPVQLYKSVTYDRATVQFQTLDASGVPVRTPAPAPAVTLRAYGPSGQLLATRTLNLNQTQAVPTEATNVELSVTLSSQNNPVMGLLGFAMEAEVPKGLEVTPVVAGMPFEEQDALDFTHVALVPGGGTLRRHPGMTPGSPLRARSASGALVSASWAGSEHIQLGAGAARVMWTQGADAPPAASGAVSGRLDAPLHRHYRGTRRLLRSYQVYRPSVQVTLHAPGLSPVDLTPDVTQMGSGRLTLVGPDVPDIDERLSAEGARIEIEVDGLVLETGRLVSARKQPAPGLRVLELTYADPLDFHNVDLEKLQVNPETGAPQALPLPTSELGHTQEIARRSGLGQVFKDPRVFTRATGYWTAPPESGGYGGLEDDYTAAYNGQGGTLTQELELIANANLSTVVTREGGVALAPLIPDPHLTLAEIAQQALEAGAALHAPDGRYLPDTRLSVSGAGFDLMQGYAVTEVSGQSNVLTTVTKEDVVTYYNAATRQTEEELKVLVDTGYVGNGNPYVVAFARFGAVQDGAPMQMAYPVALNAPEGTNLDALFPGWKTNKNPSAPPAPESCPAPGQASPSSTWLCPDTTPGMPKDVHPTNLSGKTENQREWYNVLSIGVLGTNVGGKEGQRGTGNVRIEQVKFIVESPAAIRKRTGRTEFFGDELGPCVTGVRVVAEDRAYGAVVEFVLRFEMTMPDTSRLSIKPYLGELDAAYAPKWYPGFVDEARRSAALRPQKSNTIQNPFVVEILPGNFPDGTAPSAFVYPVPPTQEGQEGLNYQSARHVATALGLREWLSARSVQLEYAGGPAWGPGRFVVVARRPDAGLGAEVGQFDVYLVLDAPQVSVTPGQEVRTSVRAGYVGTCTLSGTVSHAPTRVTPFSEDR